jgi:hypothetical protein
MISTQLLKLLWLNEIVIHSTRHAVIERTVITVGYFIPVYLLSESDAMH